MLLCAIIGITFLFVFGIDPAALASLAPTAELIFKALACSQDKKHYRKRPDAAYIRAFLFSYSRFASIQSNSLYRSHSVPYRTLRTLGGL